MPELAKADQDGGGVGGASGEARGGGNVLVYGDANAKDSGLLICGCARCSGLSGFDRTLAAAYPDCTVEKGLAVAGTDAQKNPDKAQISVDKWLEELGF